MAPYIAGTTVEEIMDDMVRTPRAPTPDELRALVYRVVNNTCAHLRHGQLGTLTVDRYVIKEDGR